MILTNTEKNILCHISENVGSVTLYKEFNFDKQTVDNSVMNILKKIPGIPIYPRCSNKLGYYWLQNVRWGTKEEN